MFWLSKGKDYPLSFISLIQIVLFWPEIAAQCSNANVVKVADMFQEVLSLNSTINSLSEMNRIQVMYTFQTD